MNKKIFIPFLIISFLLFVFEIYLYVHINFTQNIDLDLKVATQELEKINEVNSQDAQDKISLIKDRLALKGLINKGDIHLENKDYTIALTKYLPIHKKIPNDDSITKKIGDSYFYLKKYAQAYKYYSKMSDPVYLDTKMIALSLIYSKPLSKNNIDTFNEQLKNLPLSSDELFYYTNSLSCVEDFSLCKKNFSDYFNDHIEKNLENDGNDIIVMNTELENIHQALINYENFQLDDLSFKNALISGAFFENGLYPIAIEIGTNILIEKPDYRPVLKIVAKSHFELGNYIEAKKLLITYNELGDNDPEVSFFLGIIYEKLDDFVLSSIHLKKSLNLGYNKALNIRRRLIYNYYQVGDTDKMLSMFQEIIENDIDTIHAKDLSLAIFYHIINDKIDLAKKYTQKGISLYPDDEIFYGYLGWIYLQEDQVEGSSEKAKENLEIGLKMNDKNPMINLISGKLEEKLGNNNRAILFYKKTITLDDTGDFGQMAQSDLERITATGSTINSEEIK